MGWPVEQGLVSRANTDYKGERETSRVVAGMLADLEKRGLDAVREYSRKLDGWDPPDFELSAAQIGEAFARRALAEVERQLAVLPTREAAAASWSANGRVVVAEGPAVAISDDYAPEHLELHVRDT